MKKRWLTAFIAISLLHILVVSLGLEGPGFFTKPLLMPLLAAWLIAESPGIRGALRNGWLIGLGFSTLGDIFLMFGGGTSFLLGLAAFLLAHLSYIGSVIQGLRTRGGFLRNHPGWTLPFLIYPVFILFALWNGIPQTMRVPVAVYALVISSMAMAVANLRGGIASESFRTMMAGALLFVLSDSLLAINKFGEAFAGAGVAVITTYIFGQYLLAKAVIAVLKESPAETDGRSSGSPER